MAKIAQRMCVFLMVLIGMYGPPNVSVAAPTAQFAAPAPQGSASIWIPGTAFHIRDGSIAYSADDGGCIYANSSADFTANVPVPHGATLLQMTYMFYDTDPTMPLTGQSRLELSKFDGKINSAKLAETYSMGNAGYGWNTVSLTDTEEIVDNQGFAYALDWYPIVTNATMQLCGVRIDYAPVIQEPGTTNYASIAGSAFQRRARTVDYGYRGGGCTYIRSANGMFTADVNLPNGAEIYGIHVYLKDHSPTSGLTMTLKAYNGSGMAQTLATAATTGVLTSTEYVNFYTDVLTSPLIVDQSQWALAAEVQLNGQPDENVRFCSFRIIYAEPEPTYGLQTRFIAGTNVHPSSWDQAWTSDNAGCVNAISGPNTPAPLVAGLYLPENARITNLRHLYYDVAAFNTTLKLEAYNDRGTTQSVVQVVSQGTTGYGSQSGAPATRLLVDPVNQGLALSWLPGSTGANNRFCGAQVTYSFTLQLFIPVVIK